MSSLGIRYGIIAGNLTCLFLYVFYMIDKKLMLHPAVLWSSLLIYLAFMVKAGIDARKQQNGSIAFEQVIKPVFLTFVVANLIYWLFYYVLFTVVDRSLLDIQKQLDIESLQWIQKTTTDYSQQQALTQQLKDLENSDLKLPFKLVFFSFMQGCIGGFGLSALVSMLLKRN